MVWATQTSACRAVERQHNVSALRCGIITLEGPLGGLVAPLVDGFKENACEVSVATEDSVWDFGKLDFLVTYGPMQSMAWVVHRLSRMRNLPPLFVWFTEQAPQPTLPAFAVHSAARVRYAFESCLLRSRGNHRFASALFSHGGRLLVLGEMLELRRQGFLGLIGVFTETNKSFLQRHGLPAMVLPMGYHRSFGENLGLDRDIDVVFLGSTRDRRRKLIVSKLREEFVKRGIKFVIKDGSQECGYVWGKERASLLNRTKLVLNVMRQPWDDPVFRLLLTAPNKAMLLSEELLATSMGPFCAGEHFAMAGLSEMVDITEYYLNRTDQRQRIAERAYEFVTRTLTIGNMAQDVICALGFEADGGREATTQMSSDLRR